MHTLTIKESDQTQRTHEFVQIGVPLPKGEYFDVSRMLVRDESNQSILAHIKALMLWPDNSVKWVLLSLDIKLQAGEEKNYGYRKMSPHRKKSSKDNLLSSRKTAGC